MVLLSLLILAAAAISWFVFFYLKNTQISPRYGGEYIEAVVGQPMYVNPVLSQADGIDGDLVQLVFSGLVKYDESGNIAPDLAEKWEISYDKLNYTFFLKDNLSWHDGEKLTASDVQFTFNLIGDQAFRSPLRRNLQKVTTEVIDERTIKFALEEPLAPFLHNLTFGVLPAHLWNSITEEKFTLSDYNLKPIGSGPYKFQDFQKDSEGNILFYKLAANSEYYAGRPNIAKITFNFYTDEDSAISAFNKKEVMGINSLTFEKTRSLKNLKSTSIYEFKIPRYFAAFLNINKSLPLSYDEVRKALALATNRDEIVERIFHGKAAIIFSPILPGMLGYSEETGRTDFNLDQANKILEDAGWKAGENGIRKKDNVELSFAISTTDWPDLNQTAEVLKEQWEKIGVKVDINIQSAVDLNQNYIKPREYEALIIGHRLSADPDLYSFWHSSQKGDPGQNLAAFDSKEVDKLLEEARMELNPQIRTEKYLEIQKLISQDNPAVFLYSPYYLYPVNNKVKGIQTSYIPSSSRRFSMIETWYLKTKRVWK